MSAEDRYVPSSTNHLTGVSSTMFMKKKNWDACALGGTDYPAKATIGFHKKIDGFDFTKDQWEYFKETIDWLFESIEEDEGGK